MLVDMDACLLPGTVSRVRYAWSITDLQDPHEIITN